VVSTRADWWQAWRGQTVVCIASGPSLTAADCEQVRQAGLPTIVTNTSVRLAPWAAVLMGFDGAWWAKHAAELQGYAGRRVTCSNTGAKFGAQSLQKVLGFRGFGNSGAAALSLAALGGAGRIVLLGYDVQHTGGQTHWHGDHPPGLGNAKGVKLWPAKFAKAAEYAARRGSVVVNASRQTALTCFPRVVLEDELAAAVLHP
jgi:hypothetical protein